MNPNGTLTLAKASQWVPQNGQKTLAFTVARGADTPTGALAVHVSGLPAGVTAADVPVDASATGGTLTFSADTSAVLGSSTGVDVELVAGSQMLDTKPFTVKVSGAPGTLDTTFGTGGRVVFPLPDPVVAATTGNGYTRAVVQYPASAGADAGKFLVAAELETTGTASTTRKIAVVRLAADGTPDTSFGTAGYALVDGSPATQFSPVSIALDSQLRIVVMAYRIDSAGSACIPFVARLTTTGTLDGGFTVYNSGVPGGYCGTPRSVVVLPGDKIEVVGTWNNPDQSQRPLLLQLNSDGTPDNSAFAGPSDAVRLPNPDTDKMSFLLFGQMLLDSAGHYVVTGSKCDGGWNAAYAACESAVGRVTAAGAWDTTFGSAGAGNLGYSALTFGTTSNGNIQGFNASIFDASGNIVSVGNDENYAHGTLARFVGTTGAIDTTFGTSGRISPVLVAGGSVQEIDDVQIDEDGNVLGIGYANAGGPLIAVTRYSSAGVLDTTYGTGGVGTAVTSALGPHGLLQADGRLLVMGAYPRGSAGNDVAIWRFWP
ncbi:MAG: hypothetical protein ACM31C_15630 [Acidobacteriota bacterium]